MVTSQRDADCARHRTHCFVKHAVSCMAVGMLLPLVAFLTLRRCQVDAILSTDVKNIDHKNKKRVFIEKNEKR